MELEGGEVDEIRLLELTICAEPEPCCGITYVLHSTSRPSAEKENGGVYWTAFNEIKHFQVMGD